jgi:hypothetical protein
MKIPSKHRISLVFTVALVVLGSVVHAEESAFAKGSNPVLGINLIAFEPSNGELKARLSLKLPKSAIDPETYSPLRTYQLVDELTIYPSLMEMKPTVPCSAFDNYMDSTYQVNDAGKQFLYPFDHHQTRLKVFVRREVTGDSSKPKFEKIPFTVDSSLAGFTGYDITLIPRANNSTTNLDVEIDIQRTLPTKVFCVFLAVMMLVVAIGYSWMAFKVHKSGTHPDINEMVFGGALLFSFPAIRNIQPFAPPMGVLTDYSGFFLAESIVALTLIIELYFWISRKEH